MQGRRGIGRPIVRYGGQRNLWNKAKTNSKRRWCKLLMMELMNILKASSSTGGLNPDDSNSSSSTLSEDYIARTSVLTRMLMSLSLYPYRRRTLAGYSHPLKILIYFRKLRAPRWHSFNSFSSSHIL